MRTELKDRVLRFDGVSEVQPENLARFLLLGVPPAKLRVTAETEEIQQFNAQVPMEEAIQVQGDELLELNQEWCLPERYQSLNLWQHCVDIFDVKIHTLGYNRNQMDQAVERLAAELQEIENRDLTPLFQSIVYLLDVFREKNVVWGVGRGSSCASYVLFMLGLHLVDCVLLDIPMDEFFHS